MRVLIIGSGGREHAIAYKLNQSPEVEKIVVCPGNPGMQADKIEVQNIAATDINSLLNFAKSEKFDLTIVGPESSLSLGVVDLFRQNNQPILGPTKLAGQLETSKAFGKKIMMEAGVPTAAYHEFFSHEAALHFLNTTKLKEVVVKCDGLAAGKGVIVCHSIIEAIKAVHSLMRDKLLGENVEHIIIEDLLVGSEISAFALCDGESFTFLGSACDHKRLRDNDLGPNTGGMGALSPAINFTDSDRAWLEEKVFSPMMSTMKTFDMPFCGIMFAGLMRTKDGLKVLEFNVRFGDPETQVILPLIDEDLFPWLLAAANGEIKKYQIKNGSMNPKGSSKVGVHVVMAAHGYPGTEGVKIRSGDIIKIYAEFNNIDEILFFAGIEKKDNQIVTSGGRILGVTSLGENLSTARESAYGKIQSIYFSDAQYRRDIGARPKIKLAILASGNGSNAEAIIKWANRSQLAEVVCVGSNLSKAYVLNRAQEFGVPHFYQPKKKNETPENYDQRLLLELEKFKPDWIILAGFMKILTPVFIEKYEQKIINIHPSLLPLFPGTDGYGDAFRATVVESGCTIHYVDEGIDTGLIIAQKKFPKIKGETLEEFKKRGLAVENLFYPEVLEQLLKEHL